MSALAILKRVAPFILTFAAGLFIASFFVTIAAPNFNGFKRNPSRHSQFKRMKGDIEQLRREKARIEREIEVLKSERERIQTSDAFTVYEVPPPPPAPVHRGHGNNFGSGK
jgi:hypothetical protein